MSEFITAISAPLNIILTVMLCVCAVYWMFVIVFGMGSEVFHGISGLFHGHDAGIHGLETDINAGDHNFSVTGAAFRFLNFGEVPATIILSIILLFMWAGSVLTFHATKEFPWWLKAVSSVGIFIASLLLSKVVTAPLKDLFSSAEGKGPGKTDLIGRECLLTTSIGENRTGTAEAKSDAARFIIIRVRSMPGQGELPKGARATIVSVDPTAGGYLVCLPGTVPSSETPEGVKPK